MLHVEDKFIFQIEEGISMQCIWTPGHTTDHVSYLLRTQEESVLVSGDIILGGPSVSFFAI